MKKILGLIFIGCIIWFYTRCSKDTTDSSEGLNRQSITFIMSTDKPGKSYYSLAAEYFSGHPKHKTDAVTTECRTIGCVIDYLNRLEKGKWSEVNIVAHGNSKTGLNLFLENEGHKATPKRMVQEGILKTLPSLSREVVDSNTNINVLSCGIGTNPLISLSMKKIFTTDLNSPNVHCSDKYVIFRPDGNGNVQLIKANYWPYYYKRGYRPSISEIEAEMRRLYPTIEAEWAEMIERNSSENVKSMDYHIPITYTKIYTEKHLRPKFHSEASKLKWVKSQPVIKSQLKELEMDYNDFHWTVDRRIITDDNGEKQYAVKAIGMTTVLCFLQY